MRSLVTIEWLKIKKYPAFWWMLIIVLLTYPGINIMFYYVYEKVITGKEMANNIAKLLLGNPFVFPEVWQTVAYFSSFFVLLPAILVIMLVTNEYNYKTHRQNIIDGWSRNEFLLSKLIDVAIISFIATLVFTLVAVTFGIFLNTNSLNRWAEQLTVIPLFFIQTFAQLSIAFLLAYLIKKAFLALGVFLFYYLIVENILVAYLRFKKIMIGRFLPFEVSDRILVAPAFTRNFGKDSKTYYEEALAAVNTQLLLTILLTTIIWLICFRLHQKRDL
ncbi:MAG: ABC transporter permease [Sediminibacterium sp.]|nr:ABC transporter permease [Sediminibacterium sp.]MBX9780128.1 ABC transporter permease [Chitinophagaceae bacterium]